MSNENKTKKPFYKRAWFIVLAIIVVIIAIGSGSGNSNDSSESTNSPEQTTMSSTTEPVVESEAESVVESAAESVVEEPPMEVTVDELIDTLDANAMKAESTYNGKRVHITGSLSNIDAQGDYISLSPANADFSFLSVQCYLTEEQKDTVMNLTVGDTVSLTGTVSGVGEVLGYSLDVESFD